VALIFWLALLFKKGVTIEVVTITFIAATTVIVLLIVSTFFRITALAVNILFNANIFLLALLALFCFSRKAFSIFC
jgi:hypothetical protein